MVRGMREMESKDRQGQGDGEGDGQGEGAHGAIRNPGSRIRKAWLRHHALVRTKSN